MRMYIPIVLTPAGVFIAGAILSAFMLDIFWVMGWVTDLIWGSEKATMVYSMKQGHLDFPMPLSRLTWEGFFGGLMMSWFVVAIWSIVGLLINYGIYLISNFISLLRS